MINSCQYVASSSFAFWNFLEFFLKHFFDLWLVESVNVEPVDTEGRLYCPLEFYTQRKYLVKMKAE